jgi:transcriptional regulator with XRE-family HTH domain
VPIRARLNHPEFVKSSAQTGTLVTTGRNIVGEQVRRLRYERGLSQPALAAKCQRMGWDITRDTIAKIERNNRWVGDFELVNLAQSLGVSLYELFPQSVRKTLSRHAS